MRTAHSLPHPQNTNPPPTRRADFTFSRRSQKPHSTASLLFPHFSARMMSLRSRIPFDDGDGNSARPTGLLSHATPSQTRPPVYLSPADPGGPHPEPSKPLPRTPHPSDESILTLTASHAQ